VTSLTASARSSARRARPARRALAALAAIAAIAATAAVWAGPAETSGAATTYPLPVKTESGHNQSMPDPGVLLDNGNFYALSTGTDLQESSSSTSAGPWSTPVNRVNTSSIPSWIDTSKGFWAPDMIEISATDFVVYFSAALAGIPSSNPAGNDAKPAGGARCIGTAVGAGPMGPFTVSPNPLVCFTQYGPADDMTGDPANRLRGEGVIDPSPAWVTISGTKELFLVYKTQGQPLSNQVVTVRMARLGSDGVSVLGDSHQLLYSATGTDKDVIEGPSLIQNGSYFILFVAHGNFATCGYSTEWFKSQHIWAWTNNGGSTLLDSSSTGGLCGPGGADVSPSEVSGQYRIFFHAWVKESGGVISSTPLPSNVAPDEGVNAGRVMYAAVLTFGSDGYTPVIGAYQGQS
jgi:arabinan endo-1,5-alpha-L-arabinosidase